MSDNKTTIEIKHYKRISSSSKEKELVTEKVQVGSATFEFLERMEFRRKQQECLLTVDMRGKVPNECKRFIHKSKTFWMDDTSYSIFIDGLKKNNLVFTVGTFEDIINGKHTFKGMRMAGIQAPQRKENAGPGHSRSPESRTTSKYLVAAEAPEIIPLGYYYRRKEERLQHATEVSVSNGEYSIELKTRDISARGIQVVSKEFVPFDTGESVFVSFTGFNRIENTNLVDIEYLVLGIISTEQEYRLCLKQVADGETEASKYISGFIDSQLESIRGKRKLDHEDARLTAYSQILELFYTLSTPIIPFFLSQPDDEPSRVSVICKNPNNAALLNMLKDDHGAYDLTGLVSENRVRNLVALAQENGQNDPLLAIYRHRDTGKPCIVCDFEFPLQSSWHSFIRDYTGNEDFRVYKVLLRPVSDINPAKIYTRLDKLRARSQHYADEITRKISETIASGALVDVTEQVATKASHTSFMLDDDAIRAGRSIAESQTDSNVKLLPEILGFGYIEQRKEDRYQVNVSALIHIDQKTHEAVTRDISIHGLCIELENNENNVQGIGKHNTVGITLPGLQKKAGAGISLSNIPYDITCIERSDKTLLHLKRVMTQDSRKYTDFFSDLIQRNIEKLSLDLHDIITAAYSRIFSSLAAESTATIPVLIRKNDEKKNEICVALPDICSPFSEFFETSPGEFDFSFLNSTPRLSRLATGLRKAQNTEMLVYLYKAYNQQSGNFDIYSAADFEFESPREKSTFLEKAMQNDFCVVKVLAGAVQVPPEVEINSVIDPLVERSSHIATRIKSEIMAIHAVGEIVDITRQELENMESPDR